MRFEAAGASTARERGDPHHQQRRRIELGACDGDGVDVDQRLEYRACPIDKVPTKTNGTARCPDGMPGRVGHVGNRPLHDQSPPRPFRVNPAGPASRDGGAGRGKTEVPHACPHPSITAIVRCGGADRPAAWAGPLCGTIAYRHADRRGRFSDPF